MLVSVIVPVYNCSAFLEETVGHILVSGLEDFEILLIDDGSTDGTAKICDVLSEKHETVRCIHQKNAGVSAARNCGIENARGEYILFFDADDSVEPGALTRAAMLVQEQKPDMLVFGMSFDYYFRNRLYRREELVYPVEGILDRTQLAESFEALFRYNVLSPVWNKLIRRDLLVEQNIRFTAELIEMEDFVFSVNCLCCCESVYLLPTSIYRYRQAETERNTFNRLRRIPNLASYMVSFHMCMEHWEEISGMPRKSDVPGTIYTMFLTERMRYASVKEIAAVAKDFKGSGYEYAVKANAPEVYQLLEAGRFRSIWVRNAKSRLRHWLAVRVKYLRSFRRHS